MTQYDLFSKSPALKVRPARYDASLIELARVVDKRIRLGTSSWTFSGWTGLVYADGVSKVNLTKNSLPAYSRHPLFRSVGVDRSLYRPLSSEDWRRLDEGVPSDFLYIVKAHEYCVLPKYLAHPRFGAQGGETNPYFLDAGYIRDVNVAPCVDGLGVERFWFLLQFPASAFSAGDDQRIFQSKLATIKKALPEEVTLVVEVRSNSLINENFGAFLRDYEIVPCINVVPGIFSPVQIAERLKAHSRKKVLVRWMQNPKWSYEEARDAFSPFSEIRAADPSMRQQISKVVTASVASSIVCLVGNKAEGCSPKSIEMLAKELYLSNCP